jgi:hypothetical protein
MAMKIEITGNRVYDNVTLNNASMFEILKVEAAGFSGKVWEAGYVKLRDIVARGIAAIESGVPEPEDAMKIDDLSTDPAYIRSSAISVWIARLRAGEVLTFDESTQDWEWADFKPILDIPSEFAVTADDASDPTQPEPTQVVSAPVSEPQEIMAPDANGLTLSSSTPEAI